MNNGTRTVNPVSKVASLVALLAVSPRTAGSVLVTVKVTFAGNVIQQEVLLKMQL